jgi:hypothetical protein
MDTDSEKENDDVHEFPEVSDEVPAKFMASKRGNRMLLDPFNYVYEKEKELQDGKCRWRCQRKRSKIFPRCLFLYFILYFIAPICFLATIYFHAVFLVWANLPRLDNPI